MLLLSTPAMFQIDLQPLIQWSVKAAFKIYAMPDWLQGKIEKASLADLSSSIPQFHS